MISKGNIVEYIDNGKFVCGLVTEASEKRLHIINQNRREVSLPISRVVIASNAVFPSDTGREEQTNILAIAVAKRSELTREIDLQEIWEIATEEDKDTFSADFLAELYFGEEKTDDEAAAFLRAVFNDKFLFKYKNGLVTVHAPEQVEHLHLQKQKEQEKEMLLETGAECLKKIMAGEEVTQEQWPELQKHLELIENYALWGNEDKDADIARQLFKKAELNNPNAPYHLLVRAGKWKKDENIPLLKAEQPVAFNNSSIEQANSIIQIGLEQLLQDNKRQDLSELPIFTIDGASTRDFDDALHIQHQENGFQVGIHITDLTHFIKPSDPLYLESMERATSIYFPEEQIPMLPESLSQGTFSLIKDKARPAMSFLINFNQAGEVIRSKIVPSAIIVKRQLTYDQADQLIKSEKDFVLLAKLSQILRNRRLDNGALLLPFPDVNISLKKNGQVALSLSPVDTPSRVLIAEMMILANETAASYLSAQESPGLFRSQPPPRKRLVHGLDNDLFANARQRRFLSRGELTSRPKSHSGLGLPGYTTITSPIRRFLDMAMQQQINSLIRRNGILFSESECRIYAETINQKQGRANNIRQQRHRFWIIRYLETKVDTSVKALVINCGPNRITLLLTDCLFHIDLPRNPSVAPDPGDSVMVKVVRANAIDNILRVEW